MKTKPKTPAIRLRSHRPGDMGWVVQAHGALYAKEFGWGGRFEALIAEIVADFLRDYDRRWERCWLAEKSGETVGCVFVVRHSRDVAKLRLLLVDPKARGLGLGARLVDECVRFSRKTGYRKIRLWTQDVLHAAHRIYERAGFRLISRKPHRDFGPPMVGETWELDLNLGPKGTTS